MMLEVEQALETILRCIYVLDSQEGPLLGSLGQALAEDIYAQIDVPGWDSSTRDGYAVKSEDIEGATADTPRYLKVIGSVRAGSEAKRKVVTGTAIRIMTGAPIPPGSDCVVQFEDTDEAARQKENSGQAPLEIGVRLEEKQGANIRVAGDQIRRGAQVIAKGSIIGPGEINILAALGKVGVRVIRRPIIEVIATGDELTEPGNTLSGRQIYVSNNLSVAAQILRCGGIPKVAPIIRDNRPSVLAGIQSGMEADAIITIGGSSNGDFDLVKNATSDLGEVIFREVRMSPGRPFSFGLIKRVDQEGRAKNIPLFILSGNPTGTMVNFEVLVRPAIRRMMGAADIYPKMVEAIVQDTIDNRRKERRYLWSNVYEIDGIQYVKLSESADKGVLSSISTSNCLMIVPEDKLRIQKGGKARVMLLNWR
jgi:molybdopterin molybdotransferase